MGRSEGEGVTRKELRGRIEEEGARRKEGGGRSNDEKGVTRSKVRQVGRSDKARKKEQ